MAEVLAICDEYDRLKRIGGAVTVSKVDDIDALLLQLGNLLPQLTDLEAVLKVTDRWLKAYALKTKQDPGDKDGMGSKFGARQQ